MSRQGAAPPVAFAQALRVWARVAALSFGGPAGQIAVMHRILVDEKRWIGERRFMHALNYCMLLPGPEAQQLAIYIGWLLHGTRGGLVAGILFVLPGFLAILLLSILYASHGDLPLVQAVFFGVKAAVLGVVAQAVVRLGRRALDRAPMRVIALAAFLAIFALGVPFPWIVAAAAAVGVLGQRLAPRAFAPPPVAVAEGAGPSVIDARLDGDAATAAPGWSRTLRVAATWLALWLVPVGALLALLGQGHVLSQIALFFSQLALVTFGGAYAALAYMAQEAVHQHGWLSAGEMLDGLGMAETTPGPLLQVVQFVAYLAAFRDAGGLEPWLAGLAASLVATWVTFVPSFLWIFAGAPYIEALRGNRILAAALWAITAAVVGVVLNLALWFALHVVFSRVARVQAYGLDLHVPDWTSLDPAALVLSAAALFATLRLKWGMGPVLGGAALLGIAWHWLAAGVSAPG